MNDTPVASTPRSWPWRLAASALGLLLAAAMLRLAWLGDDAFITFRSVENLMQGHGPVWNTDERVQTYTHPLWFWLLSGLRAVTGECERTAMWLGLTLSSAAIAILLAVLGTWSQRAVALALLLASRAWPSYATSGLESSLTYLLLAVLFAATRTTDPARRLGRVALVTGLLGTTRLDLLVIGLPVTIACLRGVRPAGAAARVLLGLAPVALWSLAALVYYGSPFPITAYAKAFSHGVPTADLLAQGLRYLVRHFAADPVTPTAIALGVAVALVRRQSRSFAIGTLLYVAYVVKVGGDYMQGRFLVPAFTVAVVLLSSALAHVRGRAAAAVIAGALLLTFLPGVPEAAAPMRTENPGYVIGADGIIDEQLLGHFDHGLLRPGVQRATPGFVGEALRSSGVTQRVYSLCGWIGWVGYTNGPQVHVVDPWLCDPLMMRLPVADLADWRIGHFVRRIPAGYLESLASGENRIAHPGLARTWDAVRSITRDPVWSAERWRNLWRLWSGELDAGLADYVATSYRTPPRVRLAATDLAGPAGTFWFDAPVGHTAQAGGLAIDLGGPVTAAAVVVHLSGGAGYRVRFVRGGTVTGDVAWRPNVVPPDLLQAERVAVPADAAPFDTLWIDADVDPWQPAAAFVGRVELVR